MASCSKNSATIVNLLGKRKPEDGLETKPFLRRHKEKETKPFLRKHEEKKTSSDDANIISVKEPAELEKMLFIGALSRQTEISDIIDFFKDVAQVVSVRLTLNHRGEHVGYGFVEFASAGEANKALEKNGHYLHYCKIVLDEAQDYYQEVALPKKTLFVAHLCRQTTEISDLIDFFKDVGQVVRVRLVVDRNVNFMGCAFVEFASADEANMALQKKNGEYLHDRKVMLDVPTTGDTFLPPKYCIDHKVWYEEDYLQRESLPIEEDAAAEGLDETPGYQKGNNTSSFKTPEDVLLVANLSSQTTKIMHIIHFFEDVGNVVSVRLIVNHEGQHVGYGFVEFASPNQAKKALEEKNGEYLHDHKIFLMKGLDETPGFAETVGTVREKTLFVDNLSRQTEISDIINFFKDVGQVVHVRLIVDHWCNLMGCAYVEFASANEAKKALEEKNGEYLHNEEIILDAAIMEAIDLGRPTHCIDHKIWYEDYIRREGLLKEEDAAAAVDGFDETPDFSEEVAVRKKTVFVAKLSYNMEIYDIIQIFKDVGEVVRVRLIGDHWGEHVGCCFVELTSAKEAMKAVQEKSGQKFFLKVAEIDRPYPFRPKYKLAVLAKKLWYEDTIRSSLCPKKTRPKLSQKWAGKKKILSSDE